MTFGNNTFVNLSTACFGITPGQTEYGDEKNKVQTQQVYHQISKELVESSNKFIEASNQSTWTQPNHSLANNSRHNQLQGRPRTPFISAHF